MSGRHWAQLRARQKFFSPPCNLCLTYCRGSNIILIAEAKRKERERMSPRTGRPPIENPKSVKMNIRISEETAKELQECAEALNISRVNVIEKGIKLVKSQIEK